jgi:hypothetical protein
MKKLLILLILILTPFLADARGLMMMGGGVAAAAAYTLTYRSMSESDTPATSIDKPLNCADGDIMVAAVISDTAEAQTMTGWTGITAVDSSSSRLTVAYKVASSEGASYQFTSATADDSAFIACFTKSGGTWHIEAYNSGAITTSTGQAVSTGEVTATSSNSMLIVAIGNDDLHAVTTAPADMTLISDLLIGSRGLAGYYEARSSGAVTKTSVSAEDTPNDLSAIGVVIHAE